MQKSFVLILSIIFLFLGSCDPSGQVFVTNRYSFEIKITLYHDSENTTEINLKSGESFAPAAMGHEEKKNIIKIIIKNNNDTVLAEYSQEYINKIQERVQRKIKSQVYLVRRRFGN